MPHSVSKVSVLHQLRPIHRGGFSLITFGIVYAVVAYWNVELISHLLVSWIGFCVCYLAISWATIYTMPTDLLIKRAGQEDGSRIFVFLFMVLAVFACMFGIVGIGIAAHNRDVSQTLYLSVAISSLLLSWLLVHTLYIFHYAHLYYGNREKGEGLSFPGVEPPDYLDFAYFSLVMGCTFQVSDVEIVSRKIRHVAMYHGLISFALNTFVVAMSINIVAGLVN